MSTSARSICTSRTKKLARRKAAWEEAAPKYPRGYGALFSDHIGQADRRLRFRFSARRRGDPRAGNPLTTCGLLAQKFIAAEDAAPPTTHGMANSTWPMTAAAMQPPAIALCPMKLHHDTVRL